MPPSSWAGGSRLWPWLVLACVVTTQPVLAVNGLYVNNRRIDQLEADRINLLDPVPSASPSRDEVLPVRGNFSYIDLLWGRNKTHFPSLFRLGGTATTATTAATATTISPPVQYDDEQSTIKNTLNNTSSDYVGDYVQRVQPTRRPIRKRRPTAGVRKPKPTAASELTPDALALLARHYSFRCTLVPKHRFKVVEERPTSGATSPVPNKRRKTRPSAHVYVDPPVIRRIGGMLESVYDFMEGALTSTEYVEGRRSAKVVKRNVGGPTAATSVTVGDANRNKLTTSIQVTSEYTAATPPSAPLRKPSSSGEDDGSSEEDSGDSEEEEDYFGGFGGFEEPEDDDDDDDDEDDEEEATLVNDKDYGEDDIRPDLPGKRVKRRRRRKQRPPSVESEDEDTAEEYSDEDDPASSEYDDRNEEDPGASEESDESEESSDEPVDDGPEGFFGGLFSSFGRFVRSLGFGGVARGTSPAGVEEDYDDEYGEGGRSTTPRILYTTAGRRPTRSTSNDLFLQSPAYLPSPPEEDGAGGVLEAPPTSSGWFDLMMPWEFFDPWSSQEAPQEDEAPSTLAPTISTTTTTSSPGWLAQFFAGPSSQKPTEPPRTTTLAPAPQQLLSALAQYIAQTSPTPRPSTTPAPTRRPAKSYAGYQLWRITARTVEQLQELRNYRHSAEGVRLQWWTETDVLVPPGAPLDRFREYLDEADLHHELTIGDVGPAISFENPRVTRREQAETELRQGHPLTWFRYHRYADIVRFLDFLGRGSAIPVEDGPSVRLLHIGRSAEGRPLTVVRVSFAPRNRGRKRPAVFVEAGARGNQWIGPAVATWLLQRLLEPPTANGSEIPEVVRAHDWYVLPVANPDGYVYSHRHDRMWSKSRSRASSSTASNEGGLLLSALNWWNTANKGNRNDPQTDCIGVDLARNWGHRWLDPPGPSRSSCSADYAGPSPFSEPETRALRDFLLSGRMRTVRLFLSLQAYGQSLRYPPGAPGDLHEMAVTGLEAMRAAGGELPYTVGQADGEGGGTVEGYARYAAGIRYSYTLRLPDTGTHGFLLPPSNIVSIGRDTFELIRGMLEYN